MDKSINVSCEDRLAMDERHILSPVYGVSSGRWSGVRCESAQV